MNLEVKNLTFGYSKEKVLKNLTCQFKSGNFYAIIGPNGSGKSTFIRLLLGLLKPEKGEILLDQKNLDHFSRRMIARAMGYVPQYGNDQGKSTVFDTILLGRRPYLSWSPGKKDHEKAEQIIHDFSLSHLAMRQTDELSGGELQRVNIARALVQEPEILVLDEPTSSLDLKHQIEVMKLLQKISHRGITVIVTIHDLNLALRYSDRFLLLKNGIIVSLGDRQIVTEENLTTLYDMDIKIVNSEPDIFVLPRLE